MALAKEEREMAQNGKGCLGKAADDEPVFILRAQDRIAPILVSLWADIAEAQGTVSKVIEARYLRDRMRKWQYENGCKWPD